MKITYKVTENQYRDVIAHRMRLANLKPWQLTVTVFLCAVPIVLLLLCALEGALSEGRLILWALAALALSVVNLLFRICYQGRAGRELKKMIRSGKVKKGFFSEHTAEVTPYGLEVSYPGYRQTFPWSGYTATVERKEAMYLMFQDQIADIIPFEAFGGKLTREEFTQQQCRYVRDAIRKENAEERSALPADPVCTVKYSYTLETYVRDQLAARRKGALTPALWKSRQYVSVVLAIFLIYAMTRQANLSLHILEWLILLLILAPYFILFSPLMEKYIRKQLEKVLMLQPGREATLYLADHELLILGDIHCIRVELQKVLFVADLPHAVALYLPGGTPLTIPVSPDFENSKQFSEIILTRCQKHRK